MENLYGRCHLLTPWTDWDVSIHENPAQISRQGRSMTYPFDFEIDEFSQTGRFSSTTDLPYYDTTLSSCTCYDFQNRHLPCKHIYRLAVELGIVEIVKRSSTHYDKDILQEIRASGDIDNHPEQKKRIASARSAKTTPDSIDTEHKTGIFPGSGKQPYITTLSSCTCVDFVRRKLPCKHIYRLAIELGEMDLTADVGTNRNCELSLAAAVEVVESLSDFEQRIIQNELCLTLGDEHYEFYRFVSETTSNFLSCPLVVHGDPTTILSMFRRNRIISQLDSDGYSGFKRNCSLKTLFEWCKENTRDYQVYFPPAYSFHFSDKLLRNRRQLYTYLYRKYDWDSNHMHMFHDSAGTYEGFAPYPRGSIPSAHDSHLYYFPNDKITDLLTAHNCNRCLNGFRVHLSRSDALGSD